MTRTAFVAKSFPVTILFVLVTACVTGETADTEPIPPAPEDPADDPGVPQTPGSVQDVEEDSPAESLESIADSYHTFFDDLDEQRAAENAQRENDRELRRREAEAYRKEQQRAQEERQRQFQERRGREEQEEAGRRELLRQEQNAQAETARSHPKISELLVQIEDLKALALAQFEGVHKWLVSESARLLSEAQANLNIATASAGRTLKDAADAIDASGDNSDGLEYAWMRRSGGPGSMDQCGRRYAFMTRPHQLQRLLATYPGHPYSVPESWFTKPSRTVHLDSPPSSSTDGPSHERIYYINRMAVSICRGLQEAEEYLALVLSSAEVAKDGCVGDCDPSLPSPD